MQSRKLSSIFLAFIVIFLSTTVTAQSNRELFWWLNDESVRKYLSLSSIEREAFSRPRIEIENESPELLWRIFISLLEEGNWVHSQVIYERVIKIDPHPNNAKDLSKKIYEIGNTFSKHCGWFTGGLVLFAYKTAIELDSNPDYAETIYETENRCWKEWKEENNPFALYDSYLAYGLAIKLKPSANAFYELGTKFHLEQFLDSAIASYYQALRLPDETPPSIENSSSVHALIYQQLGTIWLNSGKLNKAIEAVDNSIKIEKLEPNQANSHYLRGVALTMLNRLDEAVEAFNRAIQLRPNYAEPHNGLGNVYEKQGLLEDAVKAYREAVALDSTNSLFQRDLKEAERQLSLSNQINPKVSLSVRSSVVKVKTRGGFVSNDDNNCGDGTGWIVSNSNNQAWLITNRHVVEGCNDIKVVLFDNPSKSLPAEIFKIDEEKDLAVLKVSNIPTDIKPLSIASTQPNNNDTIFVVGHPEQGGGDSWTTVKGEISAIILGNEFLQLDITVDGGNSGSPVLNKNNEVVGLIFQRTNDKRLESFATGSFGIAYPINIIQEKLDIWGVPYENK